MPIPFTMTTYEISPRLIQAHRALWMGEKLPPNDDCVHQTAVATTLLLSPGGELIGASNWIAREVNTSDQQFRVLGLADVIVAPHYRGLKYGESLVREAVYWAKQQEYDFAGLFCGPHRCAFYKRLGWRFLPQSVTFTRGEQTRRTDASTLFMMFPLVKSSKKAWPTGEIHVGEGLW